jgi:thioredoxin reductase (NADPH)
MATTRVMRSERFPDLDDEVLFPRLSDAKLAWFAERGVRRTFEPGEVLYEHAVRDAPFYVIERGRVEFVDRKPGKDVYVAEADGRTFIGDIAAFTGEPTISACVAVETTDVIAFDKGGLRDMLARWPEFGEHIFRTLLARRASRGARSRSATCSNATCCPCAGTTSTPTTRAPRCSTGSTSRAPRRRSWCTPPT